MTGSHYTRVNPNDFNIVVASEDNSVKSAGEGIISCVSVPAQPVGEEEHSMFDLGM